MASVDTPMPNSTAGDVGATVDGRVVPPPPYHWAVQGAAPSDGSCITIRVLRSGRVTVTQELRFGGEVVLRTVATSSDCGKDPVDTCWNSGGDEDDAGTDNKPSESEELFCDISLRLDKRGSSTEQNSPADAAADVMKAVPNKINTAPPGILARSLQQKPKRQKGDFLKNLAFLKSANCNRTRGDSSSKTTPPTGDSPSSVLDSLVFPAAAPVSVESAAQSTSSDEFCADTSTAGSAASLSLDTTADGASVAEDEVHSRSSTPSRNRRKLARPGKVIACQLCGTTFSKERYLKDHIHRIHEIYECQICGETGFYSSKGVEKHVAKVHYDVSDNVTKMNGSSRVDTDDKKEAAHGLSGDPTDAALQMSKILPSLLPDFGVFGNNHEFAATAVVAAASAVANATKTPFLTTTPPQSTQRQPSPRNQRRSGSKKSRTPMVTTPIRHRKPKGLGTIPCPHCDTRFSEHRYLKDHIKRRHMTFECPLCGDTNSHSLVGVERHIQAVHDPNYKLRSHHAQQKVRKLAPIKTTGIRNKTIPDAAAKRSRGLPRAAKRASKSPVGGYSASDYLTGEEYTNSIDEHFKTLNASLGSRESQGGRKSGSPRRKRKVSTPVKQPSVESALADEVDDLDDTGENIARRYSTDRGNGACSDGDESLVNSLDSNDSHLHGNHRNGNSARPLATAATHINESMRSNRQKAFLKRKKANPRGIGAVPCPYCNIKFGHVRYMREHIKRKHQTSIFQCQLCGAKFTSSEAVERHRKQTHKAEVAFFEEITDALGDRGSKAPDTPHHSVGSGEEGSVPGTPPASATMAKQTRNNSSHPVFPGLSEEEEGDEKHSLATPLSIATSGNSSVFPTNVSPTGIVSVENFERDDDADDSQDMEHDDYDSATDDRSPHKKKPRGLGTIPCPHCTKYFAMKRYLSDHVRRYHTRFNCPYCSAGSFPGLRSVTRHMDEKHRDQPGRRHVVLEAQ